ncbi:hypothetical protein ACF8LF_18885 [Pseudomonas putida]|uniref:hypothetical protein n=1 Tax=Pseudomonas putida TaxID=303 RepID=UPI00370AD2F3
MGRKQKTQHDGWASKQAQEARLTCRGLVLKASRCVHSNTRCYKIKSIPRGKAFFQYLALTDHAPEAELYDKFQIPSTSSI